MSITVAKTGNLIAIHAFFFFNNLQPPFYARSTTINIDNSHTHPVPVTFPVFSRKTPAPATRPFKLIVEEAVSHAGTARTSSHGSRPCYRRLASNLA